jgi:chemotaxis protein MotB
VLINQDRENKEAGITRGGRRQGDAGRYSASKVAFADFCLALPALFLVLWLMAARQQQSLAAIVRDAAGGAPQGQGDKHDSASVPKATLIERFPLLPGGHGPSNGNGGANRARMSYEPPAELAALSHALLSHALLSLSVDAGLSSNFSSALAPYGLRVMLHDTDHERMFMSDSPLPTPRLARLLEKMGPLFAQVQNQMLIVGHTDSVQYSDTAQARLSELVAVIEAPDPDPHARAIEPRCSDVRRACGKQCAPAGWRAGHGRTLESAPAADQMT